MSKAKIVLLSIIIVTITGAAFAYNAKRITNPWYKTNAAGNCVVTTNLFYTTNIADAADQQIFTFNTINTTAHLGACNPTVAYSAL